jgi:hypothetical protein
VVCRPGSFTCDPVGSMFVGGRALLRHQTVAIDDASYRN